MRWIVVGLAVFTVLAAGFLTAVQSLAREPEPDPKSRQVVDIDPISPREVEQLFWKLVNASRSRWEHPPVGCCRYVYPVSRFEAEGRSLVPHAIALARAYPEISERLAAQTLQDPDSGPADRSLALRVLKELADCGNGPAKAHLAAEANRGTLWTTELSYLQESDVDGSYLELYRRRVSGGNRAALRAICFRDDEETRRVLYELVPYTLGPGAREIDLGLRAQMALRQLDILGLEDWESRVADILTRSSHGYGGETESWSRWAIEVARRTRRPRLLAALRARLDVTAGLQELPACSFLPPARWAGVSDPLACEILVAYASAGGALTPMEQAILREQGYAHDPRRRLQELMEELR